jgi:uncharacterized membrane protein
MNWLNLQTLLTPQCLLLMLIGPVFALITPRLTRPDLFFSITVAPTLRQSDAGQEILRQFSYLVAVSGILGLALTLSGAFGGFEPFLAVLLILGGAMVEVAGMIGAYAAARRKVMPYQVEPSRVREVVLAPRPTRPVGGWWGQAGPFIILAAAAVCLWWRWDAIPERFPIHWDWQGRADGWAMKSWGSVFWSVIIGTLCCVFYSLMMNALAKGVRRVHSSGPESQKESRFLKSMLVMVLALEYGLAGMFGFSMLLPAWVMTVFVIAILLVGVAITVVAIRSGQGGWRLQGSSFARTPGSQAPAGDRTPDECWKGGLFYYNPGDPAVFVEKRFGIGWTINFGNPRGWFVLGGILLFAITVSGLSILLVRK